MGSTALGWVKEKLNNGPASEERAVAGLRGGWALAVLPSPLDTPLLSGCWGGVEPCGYHAIGLHFSSLAPPILTSF